MASIRKTSSGKYAFEVTVNYKKHSKTFATKGEGYLWEEELRAGKGQTPSMSFGELLQKYADNVSVKKKGQRWEQIRIAKFQRDEIAQIKIADLSRSHFADWRDRRLKEVSALSVLREWALINHCLHIAVNEWEYLTVNPIMGLKKPKAPPARDRLVSQDEIDRLCFALNYKANEPVVMVTSRVGAAFVFAIETALRMQEICNLTWDDINGSVAKINASKTFAGVREVPLSSTALKIMEQCKGLGTNKIFNLEPSQVDALFRKAKKQTMIEGLHFHDSRAEAITRLAKKLDILDLARMVGHKDLKMLMVYYRETAKDIAKKLD
jgi:integrase